MELPKLPDLSDKPEKMVISFNVDAKAYRKVKEYLQNKTTSMSQIISDWLEEFAKKIEEMEGKKLPDLKNDEE